MRPY